MDFKAVFFGEHKHKYLNFILLYGLIYACNAIYGTFAPVYLNSMGFNGAAVGSLLALGPFIALVAQPVWGMVGDRATTKNMVLQVLIAGTALVMVSYPLYGNFYYLMVATALYTFFQTAITPISDAITLEYADLAGWKFGPIRMAGTVGFAIMAVIAGFLANHNMKGIFFILYPVTAALALLATFSMPRVKGHQAAGRKVPIYKLFKYRKLMLFMSFNVAIQITLGYYYAFFPIYFRQMGANNSLIGWSSFISAVSEIPFLLFADRILKKLGIKLTLIISGVITALRWFLLYYLKNPIMILPLQVMHGCMFIVLSYCLATFINREVPKELKASGQTLNGLVTLGISRILGSLLGGWLSDITGVRQLFLYNSILAILIVAVYAVLFFCRGRENKESSLGAEA